MTNLDFVALGLQRGDRIWVQDNHGAASWGKYLEVHDPQADTFLFLADKDSGYRVSVSLSSIQKIAREGAEQLAN